MAEIRLTKVEQGQTKIRNVPIAVTPEGFWCCPSPVMFQKTLKTQHPLNKPKSASENKKHSHELDKKPSRASSKPESVVNLDDQRKKELESPVLGASMVAERSTLRSSVENLPRKVAIEFGESGTSDLKVVLLGKQGFIVKLSVHKNVLEENSTFFAQKLLAQHVSFNCIEVDDCEDVETYVETVGLMYCKELKQRLIKQSVSRVLRILKVAELLGFKTCMESCLEFLEAVPWVGEEEEERVVSSVLRLQTEGTGIRVGPILKRVASDVSKPPKDTLSHVLELVLKSHEEKGRREMKSIVLKLLRENNSNNSSSSSNNNKSQSSPVDLDLCNDTIYDSCRTCLGSLLFLFRQIGQPEFPTRPAEVREPVVKQMTIEADNLVWLLDILADRHAADEYAVMWASQQELAGLHPQVPVVNRHHISCITARLFVGIGRGELLPCKDTRHLMLKTWLEPLIDDYRWLQHGCRSFDRKVVEEGIGRTILTLPLEEQRIILLGWLGRFLKAGDNCPNLQRAFEVWWRRTFVRPYVDAQQPLD